MESWHRSARRDANLRFVATMLHRSSWRRVARCRAFGYVRLMEPRLLTVVTLALSIVAVSCRSGENATTFTSMGQTWERTAGSWQPTSDAVVSKGSGQILSREAFGDGDIDIEIVSAGSQRIAVGFAQQPMADRIKERESGYKFVFDPGRGTYDLWRWDNGLVPQGSSRRQSSGADASPTSSAWQLRPRRAYPSRSTCRRSPATSPKAWYSSPTRARDLRSARSSSARSAVDAGRALRHRFSARPRVGISGPHQR